MGVAGAEVVRFICRSPRCFEMQGSVLQEVCSRRSPATR